MYASKIHYLKKDSSGRTLAFGERLDSSQLSVMLELRNYYRLLATLRADVSTLQNPILIDLGEWMTRHLYAHCPSLTPSVGAPVGFVVAAVKGIKLRKAKSLPIGHTYISHGGLRQHTRRRVQSNI